MRFLKALWAYALTLVTNPVEDPFLHIAQQRLGDVLKGSEQVPLVTPPKPCVNGPQTRKCWLPGFNIDTDYEKLTPNGRLREYELHIHNGKWAGDGYTVDGMLINGRYPGPLIEANWGDTLRITVHNHLSENQNGTAMHWHGLRQLHTTMEDGVPGVTQCPIQPEDKMVYQFRATQYGTSWYHSHFSLQYADGIAGPLVIHGPSSANYDQDLGPLMITDWYHQDAFALLRPNELEKGVPAFAPSMLVNGFYGGFKCNPSEDPRCDPKSGRYYTQKFVPGMRYKWRIINTSATNHYKLWFEDHDFTVTSTDFVPIKPYNTSSLFVGIGQRYDIVIEAKPRVAHKKSFGIYMQACNLPAPGPEGTSPAAIIRYDLSDSTLPSNSPDSVNAECVLEEIGNLHPVLKWQVPSFQEERNTNLNVAQFNYTGSDPNQEAPIPPYHSHDMLWELKNATFMINWSDPTIGAVLRSQALPHFYEPVPVNGTDDDWYYFRIRNVAIPNDPNAGNAPPIGHPIHLHGHDFAILAQSTDPDIPPTKWNFTNPPRRDVALLPTGGLLVIAFRTDNPGVWLMHCHIAWHASAGLALQILERQDEIPSYIPLPKSTNLYDRCQKWRSFQSSHNPPAQDDSGI